MDMQTINLLCRAALVGVMAWLFYTETRSIMRWNRRQRARRKLREEHERWKRYHAHRKPTKIEPPCLN